MPKIAFTGGGTMGHVLPALALVPGLTGKGYEILFIGSRNAAEKNTVEGHGIPFFPIRSGKLRRYADIRNITDIFNVAAGFFDALKILKRERPDIVFSKGGFVSAPVVAAAYLLRIPAILHESDLTIGLANKLSMPFVKTVCYSFEETAAFIGNRTGVLTGIPVRRELFEGEREQGRRLCGFDGGKPVLLVMGGTQGSRVINETVYGKLDEILEGFDICHICGRDGIREEYAGKRGYKAFGYVHDDMKHIYAAADIIVSRAGATSLFEYLALKKPNILIPISQKKSRGDQLKNARSFETKGYSRVITEEQLDGDVLLDAIRETYKTTDAMITKMNESGETDSAALITGLIEEIVGGDGR